MSWTAPRTFVTAEIETSGIFNTHVRDNLFATETAKAQAAGDLIYATGANALARLPIGLGGKALRVNNAGTGLEWANVPTMVYKSANEIVNSSTTLQDDDALFLPLAANEVWAFTLFLLYDSDAAADIKFAFTVPSGATLHARRLWYSYDYATILEGNYAAGDESPAGAPASGTPISLRSRGVVINGANAGNLQLQWAQRVNTAVDTIVKKGSWLKATRLA